MNEETSTYTIRVPKDLKAAFELACKAMDRTGAQLLRDNMRQYVDWYMKTHAQQSIELPKKGKK